MKITEFFESASHKGLTLVLQNRIPWSFFFLYFPLWIQKNFVYLPAEIKITKKMEAITFSPAQVHVFNLVSHIKTTVGLDHLREQLAAFYAKQVDEEMDALWDSGQFDEKRLQELRGSHFRTPYNK